jgi:hypothetical protein
MAYLGNGFTKAEFAQNWDATIDYMDIEDESTVMLVDNPQFKFPLLHEEVYRFCELNPGIVDLNVRAPSAFEGKGGARTNGSTSQHVNGAQEAALLANEAKLAESQANGVETGLSPQGIEVKLAEKVNDAEPAPNGNLEVKLPGQPVLLIDGEAEALNRNM